MDAKLNELLLKTRKGATASFGVKEWGMVLTELGFGFQTTKTGRTVTEVKITSPLGHETLTITKEPRYRAITFYELYSWLKTYGLDLVEVSSIRLGLDTPNVEKKLKDLYERDLTNTGTCPVCEGNFKGATSLVHHGYTRPGDGAQHGDCFAVGYECFELSPKGAIDYLARAVRPHLEDAKSKLAELQSGKVIKFFKKGYAWGKNAPTIEVTVESDKYEFESMLKSAIYNAERDLKWTEEEIARLEAKIANWKLDVLPEIKYAGKFKVAG